VSKKIIFVCTIPAMIAAFWAGSSSAITFIPAQFGPPRSEQSQQEREIEERRQKQANKQRQEEIRKDTQKLFQLATELKDAVDKSNEHVLSLDVVRKAEEVEKLAKKVKEKMKEGIGKPLIPEPPPVSPRPPL